MQLLERRLYSVLGSVGSSAPQKGTLNSTSRVLPSVVVDRTRRSQRDNRLHRDKVLACLRQV